MNRILIRYGSAIFFAFVVGGFAGGILVDTPFNATYRWAFQHLALPIVVAVGVYTYRYREALISANNGSRARVYGFAVAFIPLLVVGSGGYVGMVNALCGQRASVLHEGRISRKFETSGRFHSWELEIDDEATHAPLTLSVSPQTYAARNVGDRYARSMHDGCLGIPYDLRH